MHYDICTQVERILQKRCSKCIVYAKQCLCILSNDCHCSNISNTHQWIGGCLHPYQLCLWSHCFPDKLGICRIHIYEADTKFLKHFGEKPIGASIHICTCNHFITWFQ